MSPLSKAPKAEPTAASGPGVAYSYIRFSTRIQETGDSLHRQKTLADDYAAKHGLKLDSARFEDLGVSGFRGKQIEGGALGKFLLAVRQKKILPESTLLVEAFDRFSRGKLTDQLKFVLELVSSGIKVITLYDGLIYDQSSFDKARIVAAQKARWAKIKAAKTNTPATPEAAKSVPVAKPAAPKPAKKKFVMSAAAKAKISAAAKARWAKVKAEKAGQTKP
jgi:DNA invertase Pin-like site-specific DNA recombinase